MIRLYDDKGTSSVPVTDVENFYITSEYNGNKTLCFDISPKHKIYPYIKEEKVLEFDNLLYTIKAINERGNVSSIECALSLDDLIKDVSLSFEAQENTLSEILQKALVNTGWQVINAELVPEKTSLTLTDCNVSETLKKCQEAFGVVFKIENKKKTLTVIKPDNIQPCGVYFTDELNLNALEFKGDSYEYCTRLIPVGKDNLTIEAVNNGLNYVEDFTYSNKIITQVWRNEDYTDPHLLKDDAIEQLKILAVPKRSYQCTVTDLSKINPKYKLLSFGLYDIVTLVDRSHKSKINHRVVEYKEYPFQPEKNEVTLSTITQKIEGIVASINGSLDNVSTDILVAKQKTNEIKRDLDATVSIVSNMYTKGETDIEIKSSLTQASDSIRFEVSETYATKDDVKSTKNLVEQTLNGWTNTLSSYGGNNLIKGSGGFLNCWKTKENVEIDSSTDTKSTTSSGNAFIITSGKLSQDIPVIPGASYAYRFKYKVKPGNNPHAVMSIGPAEVSLLQPSSDSEGGWSVQEGTITPATTPITLLFSCSDAELSIGDPIFTEGKQAGSWRQAPNELVTESVKIFGSTITMERSDSPFKSVQDNQQQRYENKDTGETIAQFSADGVLEGKTIIEDSLTLRQNDISSGALRFVPVKGGCFLTIND